MAEMAAVSKIVGAFRMTDDAWKRHANPWSVWTRFAAIPLAIVAIWSRVWLGWWCLVPVALVLVWLWLNTRVFAPVETPTTWVAKGIYGEKLWLLERDRVPAGYRAVLRMLIGVAVAGFVMLALGLITLAVWPTVFGASMIALSQLWRIDRFGLLFDETRRNPGSQSTPV
jgi:hypothetical protein